MTSDDERQALVGAGGALAQVRGGGLGEVGGGEQEVEEEEGVAGQQHPEREVVAAGEDPDREAGGERGEEAGMAAEAHARGRRPGSGRWQGRRYSPPRSTLYWSKSTAMPLRKVLQCRVSAAMATASAISSSLAPASRAALVSLQTQ